MPRSKAHFATRRKQLPALEYDRRPCGRCCEMVLCAGFMSTLSTPPPSNSSSLAELARRLSEVSVVRFGVVGVSNSVVSYGAFRLAHRVLPAFAAQCIAYTIGTVWSYYWNRRWTFQSQGKVASEASRFMSLQIAFMLLSSALLGLFVDHLHWQPTLCWIGVSAFVTVLNFVASRYWAFKPAH